MLIKIIAYFAFAKKKKKRCPIISLFKMYHVLHCRIVPQHLGKGGGHARAQWVTVEDQLPQRSVAGQGVRQATPGKTKCIIMLRNKMYNIVEKQNV